MKKRSLTSLIPLVAVSSAAAAENSAEVRRRRPPRHLNREQGTSIVRSKARRNLQGEEGGEDDGVPYLSACIGRYPGYNLELGAWVNPNGHVRTIYFQDGGGRGTEMLFEFDVYENEDHCKDCRIHIARGMTCDDADQVGGHYWNSDVLEDDPWTRRNGAYYNSNNNGKAIGAFEIDNGYSYEENLGHAVVIYAMDGSTKIGCGLLEAGDRGMSCDPFEDGDGGRDDGDEDESSSEGDSELSQDDVSEDSSNSASSPSSPSASAPSPSAPSPSYNSDISFDHGDRSDSEVKHDAESSDDRRGHRHDYDDEDLDHESSATFSSSTVESKHGKSSKSSKSSSSKTKSSRESQGKGKGSSSKQSSKKEEMEQLNYSEMDESASKESKQKSKKSAKMVRRRQR